MPNALLSWIAARRGYDLVRLEPAKHALVRRMALFRAHAVGLVFDVGANEGGYGAELRRMGFTGDLVSFEPVRAPFAELSRRAKGDGRWKVVNAGIGEASREAVINVAGNKSLSSSLLPMMQRHVEGAPDSAYVGTETIRLESLADAIAAHGSPGARLYVKLDVQGYERRILEASTAALGGVAGVQLEMSMVPLYEGEALVEDMIALMRRLGFVLSSLEQGYCDERTGQMLQVDGVFFRS
ncbi:MAG TPA: FkbM family methyltransferase [Anaeromyxobacter sp.]